MYNWRQRCLSDQRNCSPSGPVPYPHSCFISGEGFALQPNQRLCAWVPLGLDPQTSKPNPNPTPLRNPGLATEILHSCCFGTQITSCFAARSRNLAGRRGAVYQQACLSCHLQTIMTTCILTRYCTVDQRCQTS